MTRDVTKQSCGGDITWHESQVQHRQREKLLRQSGTLVWFTGLSGSGKSTIAFAVEKILISRGHLAYVLDGDNIRHGLSNNLGFATADRTENIRRIGEVGKLFVDAGLLTLSSFVSPYRADRDKVRGLLAAEEFFEIYVNTPLEVCEQRDPKGLYMKARAGEIVNFTGLTDPYEPPTAPELVIRTAACKDGEVAQQVDDAAQQVIRMLEAGGRIHPTD